VREVRRLEVITGALGRRRWSAEAKARIVAESLAPGVVISEVARRHDLRPQQLFAWRHQARQGRLALPAAPEQRQAARQEHSRPVLEDLRTWLDAQLAKVPRRARIAEAIRYALKLWSGLRLFLDDGRIEIDTMWSSARSARSRSIARTPCSPAPIGAASNGA
jgi:transposase